MIRYPWDEGANHDILRAVRARWSDIDVVSIQEAGHLGASDDQVIEMSVETQRVIVTSDRRTLIGLATARIRQGVALPGVVVTDPHMSPGAAAADLALIVEVVSADELKNQFIFLPL